MIDYEKLCELIDNYLVAKANIKRLLAMNEREFSQFQALTNRTDRSKLTVSFIREFLRKIRRK